MATLMLLTGVGLAAYVAAVGGEGALQFDDADNSGLLVVLGLI